MDHYMIRSVQEKDLDELVELCGLHAAYEQSSYDPSGKKERLRDLLFNDRPNLYAYVVERDNRLLGYTTVTLQTSTWDANHYLYLDCLFMREEARGMGIGEALMHKVKEEAKRLGCDLIQWQTPEFNVRAIKFYHRIGGQSLKKERFFWSVD